MKNYNSDNIPKYFIPIFGVIVAIVPLAMDAYVPAIPTMAKFFNVSVVEVNYTLSYFLVGYALGQFFGGPLSDQIGRKKIGISGMVLFLISTFLIVICSTITQVQILRVFQAIGGGFSSVICLSSVRDIYGYKKAGKKYALVFMIMLVAPLIAPTIGSFLLKISWQAIFIFLTIYALIVLLLYRIKIPETHLVENSKPSLRPIFKQYKEVITHKVNGKFIPFYYLTSMVFSLGVMMTFLTNSAIIYMEYFKISPDMFPLYFGFNIVLLIICTKISMNKLGKTNPRNIFRVGGAIQLIVLLIMLILVLIGKAELWSVFFLMVIATGMMGLINPSGSSIYISFFKKRAGSASGLLASCTLVVGSTLGFLTGFLYDGTLLPIVSIMFICTLISNIVAISTPKFGEKTFIDVGNIL